MGFLKNLFSGESKEEKQFWAAYKECFKKPNKKNLEKLDEAMQAFPSPWQGYFLKSLCYGVGTQQIPYDPQLGKEMQMKAQEAAKGTPEQGWVNEFYTWFEKDAYCFYKDYSESERRVRQAAIAAINMYAYEQPVIGAHDYKDDAKLWAGFLNPFHFYDDAHKRAVNDAEAVSQLFVDFTCIKGADRDMLVSQTNTMLKAERNMYKKMKKNVEKEMKGKEANWDDYTDMYDYIIGHGLLHDHPYTLMEWESVQERGEASVGLEHLLIAADRGSTPAFHEAMEIARSNSQNMSIADGIVQQWGYSCYEDWEVNRLMPRCVKLEDNEAMRLAMKYYPQQNAE